MNRRGRKILASVSGVRGGDADKVGIFSYERAISLGNVRGRHAYNEDDE